MGHQKAKSRKTCCKNNQMYLSWACDSFFAECSFWFWVNKFLPNGIRPADNNFVTPSHTCGEQFAHRRFFYFWLLCPRFRRISFYQYFPGLRWAIRVPQVFSIFGFCARVLSGYLFFNASQRLIAADRPRTHSCGCALFLFLRWKHRFLRFFSAEAPTRKPRSEVFLLLDFTLPLKTAILYAVQAQQRLLSDRTYYRFVSFGRIPISKQLFSY